MRLPGSIEGTANVYSATWASFIAIFRAAQIGVSQGGRVDSSPADIKTVVFPAMGCGYGRVRYSESARQMAAAYVHFLEPPLRLDRDHAARIERDVTYRDDKIVVR